LSIPSPQSAIFEIESPNYAKRMAEEILPGWVLIQQQTFTNWINYQVVSKDGSDILACEKRLESGGHYDRLLRWHFSYQSIRNPE